ncbi:MAG: hypothetical protein KatS3mg050_0622 [Litorilinea sp.]|nr:MAG: hypothetical protein KatS3mg050_0622 [Litorilinea sp.]
MLVIDEVLYDGSAEEFVALYHSGDTPLDLGGWLLGDAEVPGDNEGLYALPAGYLLQPGATFVVARNGAAFRQRFGRAPDAELEESDPAVTTLARERTLASGTFALRDQGDEVVLLTPARRLADAVAFAEGEYGRLQLGGYLAAGPGQSLQRVPGPRFPGVTDVRERFLLGPPRPFEPRGTPLARAHPRPTLADGMVALWGTLAAFSNYSPGGTAPPHYVLAAGAAAGLDFVALADPHRVFLDVEGVAHALGMIAVPGWRWQGNDGRQAVVYAPQTVEAASWEGLSQWAGQQGWPLQALADVGPVDGAVAALTADTLAVPDGLARLFQRWSVAGRPLLPAGNHNPPLPALLPGQPRYTGLAVRQADVDGVLEALRARRGWLTSAAGLWVTLQAEEPDGQRTWMGQSIAPANQVVLHVRYGDQAGEALGVAIWQDGQPVRQLDIPSPDGHWILNLPAVPGSWLAAVVTQADGDFAVTAPLQVRTGGGGQVLLNEVLPAPAGDLNGDGVVDSDDEFIELYNPGNGPVSLVGWQLVDGLESMALAGDAQASARRFVFGPGRYLNGRSRLVLWRRESGLSLNNDQDGIRLLDPTGAVVDQVAWHSFPGWGTALARLPDGSEQWSTTSAATPGQANQGSAETVPFTPPSGPPPLPSPPPPASKGEDEDERPAQKAAEGQAPGPPGSLAEAKRRGLEATVEFRAQVVAPPGLFNSAIYVAEPALDAQGNPLPLAGLGIQVYLNSGDFLPMEEGSWVLVRGVLKSFRGEMELRAESPEQVWPFQVGTPLQPLPVRVADIGESLEGRLVTFQGVVSGWQGDSIFLADPDQPEAEAVRVTVRSSLGWRRPYVNRGERWQVTGIVSQFAREHPWNGGYRVLVRYPEDLRELDRP